MNLHKTWNYSTPKTQIAFLVFFAILLCSNERLHSNGVVHLPYVKPFKVFQLRNPEKFITIIFLQTYYHHF